jgi:hypothetical protein
MGIAAGIKLAIITGLPEGNTGTRAERSILDVID